MESANNSVNKNRWAVLFIVVMVTFMATLDSSIVNVALPVMAKSLNVTSGGIQSVVTSYLVIISATILIFGRLGDMTSKTKVFKFGIALFTLGSLFCGITSSLSSLVLARVIQAIGAAGVMANSQGIITEVFPVNERGRALGITGTFVALGALVGPALGGIIVDATSWKYIFLINLPIGIITLFYAFKILRSAFVAAAAISNKLGWEYFEKLKQNGLVVESGNSAVQNKVLTGEYDAVIILEENMLKIAAKGEPVKVVYPKDGVIMIPSPIAMFNSSANPAASKKVLDWFLSAKGQEIIVKGWMHSVRDDVASPIGADPLKSFIDNTMKTDWEQYSKESEKIKETFRSKVVD